jgi:hypothetical protein
MDTLYTALKWILFISNEMENILFQTYQFLEGHVLTQASLLLENSTFSSKSKVLHIMGLSLTCWLRGLRTESHGHFCFSVYDQFLFSCFPL